MHFGVSILSLMWVFFLGVIQWLGKSESANECIYAHASADVFFFKVFHV
ncbi:hypothetical protein BVRB_8g195470 [Beta vulgaris subsp. vulgaris]|nr:hypothetical protein BVRB_8g195470 [Beta vulgaris subsp. vulgaris]